MLDTAGVREEKEEGVNEIEVEGMKRARIAAKDAHIVVGVVDSTDYERGLEAVDELINGDGDFDDWKKDNILYVVNKIDLKNEMKDNDCLSKSNSFGISCTTSEGVNDFLSVLTTEALSLVSSGNDEASSAALSSLEGSEGAVITRARHRRHVEAAADALG